MEKKYPRLCGGTFFTLLYNAVKGRSGYRNDYIASSDGRSQSDVFIGLIRVVYPDFVEPDKNGSAINKTFKSSISNYRLCKRGASVSYIPFYDNDVLRTFDERVKNDYYDAVAAMQDFMDRHMDIGTSLHMEEKLMKALLSLLEKDKAIPDNEIFYITQKGIKKSAIETMTEYCLPEFLLGVLHYAIVVVKDHKVGESTIDEWCPKVGGSDRVYTANFGQDYKREFAIKNRCEIQQGVENADDSSDTYSAQSEDEEPSTTVQQFVQNQFNINQTGPGVNIGFVQSMKIQNGKVVDME